MTILIVSSILDSILLWWYVFFFIMYHSLIFVPSLNMFPLSLFQNILSIYRYNSVRKRREDNFKAEVAEKEEALQTAKSNAEAASK